MNDAMNKIAQCIEYHLHDKFGMISQIKWEHMGKDKRLSVSCNRTLADYSGEQSNPHPFLLAEIVLSPRLMLPDEDIQMNDIMRSLDDMIKRVKNRAVET
jgi:hypothetical protein|tara:strand:- start:27271 stop:27570 length:300 start_codon:yes stop_codon:yes gene_type:complete